MHRRNFGRRSGVILDLCGEHGAWFDSDELARIVEWLRAGGLEAARRRDAEEEREMARARRLGRELEDAAAARGHTPSWPDLPWEVFARALEGLFHL